MRKDEYLNILSERLNVLPADEHRDIMEYYKEYFEEAGEENEEEVIKELGDVEELAKRILADNGMELKNENIETYGSEQQLYNNNSQLYNQQNGLYTQCNQTYNNGNGIYNQYSNPIPPKQTGLSTGWKVFIAIVTFPIWIGIVTGVCGLIFGLGVGAVACFASSIGVIIAGISTVGFSVGTGLLFIGAGFIVLTVGFGLLMATVGIGHLVGKAIRAIFGKRQQPQYIG